jgi:C4-dicarboxylate transporter
MIDLYTTIIIICLIVFATLIIIEYIANKIHKDTYNSIEKFFDSLKTFFYVQIIERFIGAAEETEIEEDDLKDNDNTI